MRLSPKNWDKFQQYKDRKPQWIKLQRDLLNDFSYASVRIGTKATLPLLWLLSSEYDDGVIEASVEEISFRIHIDPKTVQTAIDELLSLGFYSDLDASVQDCTEAYKMVPREEKRRDREETEKEKEVIPQEDFSNHPNINISAFNEWMDYKKYKTKAPITKIKNMMNSYSYDQQQQMVDTSIMNNYKGLFEPKGSQQHNMSFKQQDRQRTDDSIDDFLEARDKGFDLRNINNGQDYQDVEVIEA